MENDDSEYECSDCGQPVQKEDRVCKSCGAQLDDAESPTLQDQSTNISQATDRASGLPPFESAASRARLATAFLVISIALDALSIVSTYAQIDLLSGIKQGRTMTEEVVDDNDSRQQTIGVLQLLVLMATGTFFLMWIHRAYKNLVAFGATDLKHSPGWAVGGFFVPVMNLYHPFQVVTEIWKASDSSSGDGSAWQTAPSSPIIGEWWGSYLVSGIFGSLLYQFGKSATTVDSFINASWSMICVDGVSIFAAFLTIRMIKGVNSRHESKGASLRFGVPTQ